MIKKLFSTSHIILMISILLTVFALSSCKSNVTYSGTCGDNLTWEYDKNTATLIISGKGDMYGYYYNGKQCGPWEDFLTSDECINTVKINYGVTSIGDNAFFYCTDLKSVSIPDSVTSVGYDAFCGCINLESIFIPDSVTNIVRGAFSGCNENFKIYGYAGSYAQRYAEKVSTDFVEVNRPISGTVILIGVLILIVIVLVFIITKRNKNNNNYAYDKSIPNHDDTGTNSICPNCNTINDCNSSFCKNCGQKIK